MIKRAPQAEQWQVLHRLSSVGCPVDEHPTTPLHVFTDYKANLFYFMSDSTGIALPIHIEASTSVTISRFHLQVPKITPEISWLGLCDFHLGPRKYYCFDGPYCGRNNGQYASEDVLNHRTLHRGALKRGGFLSGFLLGTFRPALRALPTSRVMAKLIIDDLFEHQYHFEIVLLDHTHEWDGGCEDRADQRASDRELTDIPPADDDPM